ncbi:odorant receptor 2a-like [Leptopilina heterotoma]|uniref:odorant receptor 2a-like n=1 Tax=Leptopilina heterotoma TaxID=63436 RepID=UPI001CA9091A|nr:odorant receptor 2a-like [Leptopilina heterotoma]
MNVAKRAISHLGLVGTWRPKKISNFSKQLYRLYSCFIFTILTLSAIYILVYIFKFSTNVNSLTESLLVLFGILGAILKMLLFIIRQEEIISVDRMLTEKICLPRDKIEEGILAESENTRRKQSNALMIGCYFFSICLCLNPLISSKKLALPFPSIWIPLNFESTRYYQFIYLYQVIVLLATTIILCCCDLYFSELMEKISAEIDVFKHRLYILPQQISTNYKLEINQYESTIIKDWLHFHLHLIKMIHDLNNSFNLLCVVQFFISTAVLGLAIFNLAKAELFTTHFWYICVYLLDFTWEIFQFCYYGEKLIVKSSEIVNACYNVNWNKLSKNSKMSLYIIMIRASKPMKVKGGSMITMSIGSFVAILKVAYSIFNVLRENR